jgi:phospholipase D1/2
LRENSLPKYLPSCVAPAFCIVVLNAEHGLGMKSILKEGKNCWRIRKATKVAFLVDAAAYFDAFARAAARAKASILIVGWDIDSRIRLFPEEERDGMPSRLWKFMNAMVKNRENLNVYILEWDFAVLYAFERELFPVFKIPWKTNKRIHFHLDSDHAVGGSHHQKVVVIDDQIAFVGGIDLTKRRWDTPEHAASDPHRIDPSGKSYGPFHDVQIALEGPAAETLGDLARTRWERATGEKLKPLPKERADLWPAELSPDLEDVDVAVVRTDPAHKGREDVREVEALYLDTIASAQRFLYIENQFLTSFSVGRALAAALEKKDGPEIVIVVRVRSDWLEETTMGAFRAELMARLREANVHGKFHVYYPEVPNHDGEVLNVHSKVMIVDDRFVRIGSSNLTNRSMGVDTECDVAIESTGETRIEKGIVDFRNRLLGEHLGVPAHEVERTMRGEGSLVKSIERLRGSGRTLREFPEEGIPWVAELFPDSAADPIEPIDPEKLMDEFVPKESAEKGSYRLNRFMVLLLGLLALAAAWRWTPLGEWIDWDTMTTLAARVRESDGAPFIVISAYVVGSLVMFPVTVMIVVTAFTFGPASGFFYSLAGCVLAGTATYGIGRALGRDTVSRLAGSRVNRLSRRLAEHGVITVSTVRIIPIAPFTVVNLVAGASHIRFWDFLFGTILGMAPGIGAITIFGYKLEAAVREPGLWSFALLALLTAAIIAAALIIKSKVIGRKEKSA